MPKLHFSLLLLTFLVLAFVITPQKTFAICIANTYKMPVLGTYKSTFSPGESINITVKNTEKDHKYQAQVIKGNVNPQTICTSLSVTAQQNDEELSLSCILPNNTNGSYFIKTIDNNIGDCNTNPATITVSNNQTSSQTGNNVSSGTNTAQKTSGAGITCDPNTNKKDPVYGQHPGTIYTALGCLPTEPSKFVQTLLKFAVTTGGAIALLLMIAGAFRMITSSGNPDAIKAGNEQFTSAIIGLLFIIFSVLLLKIIGVDILQIPGFTT